MNFNTAEWIIAVILSVTLFVFLIVGIVFLIKLIGITKEAKKFVIKAQDVADTTNDVVENVKGMTSIGGVVKTFTDKIIDPKNGKGKEKSHDGETEED